MSEETVKIKLHTIATYNDKEYELEELCNNLLETIDEKQNKIDKALYFMESENLSYFPNEKKLVDILKGEDKE